MEERLVLVVEEAASYDCGCGDCWMEKKRIRGKREWSIFFIIILLGSLYYFIELYVKIKKCDMSCKIRW